MDRRSVSPGRDARRTLAHTGAAGANAVYDRLLQAKPSDGLARFNYGRAAALSGKNLDRGARELESLMADPPQIWPPASVAAAHFRLGSIYEQQGKKELARGQYEEAVKRNPKNEDAKKALASMR